MSARGKIYFESMPFSAVVEGKSESPIKLIAVVYEDSHICGVGIKFEDRQMAIYGQFFPRDIITAWRATEILKLLKSINSNEALRWSYCAACRYSISDKDSCVNRITKIIGKREYKKIMAMSVPEEIVKIILNNQDLPNVITHLDKSCIGKELVAGTIVWREEFLAHKINPPEIPSPNFFKKILQLFFSKK